MDLSATTLMIIKLSCLSEAQSTFRTGSPTSTSLKPTTRISQVLKSTKVSMPLMLQFPLKLSQLLKVFLPSTPLPAFCSLVTLSVAPSLLLQVLMLRNRLAPLTLSQCTPLAPLVLATRPSQITSLPSSVQMATNV